MTKQPTKSCYVQILDSHQPVHRPRSSESLSLHICKSLDIGSFTKLTLLLYIPHSASVEVTLGYKMEVFHSGSYLSEPVVNWVIPLSSTLSLSSICSFTWLSCHLTCSRGCGGSIEGYRYCGLTWYSYWYHRYRITDTLVFESQCDIIT